jgi:hypothetical protein
MFWPPPEKPEARQYRFRAEELRCAAESMKDDYCKKTTLRLAEDYERMGAEDRAVTKNQ